MFPLGVGLVFIWSPAHTLWQTAQTGFREMPGVAEGVFKLFELFFLVAGLIPVGLGLLILFGRCRVEWKGGQLRAVEILGPLKWTRRMPNKRIRKLEVAAAASTTASNGNTKSQAIENFSAVAAEFEDDSKKLIVLGYPKQWLLAVAQELKSRVGGEASSFAPAKVEVVETTPQNENDADVLDQPADSRVQVTEHATGLRLNIPSSGIWRGSKGFFFFSLLWCGFTILFTFLAVTKGLGDEGHLWLFILLLAGFWAIGLGMMAMAINMGRRTAEFAVESGRLHVETKGIFGTKQTEWRRDEITAIRADRSGMEINDRPVIELQIHPRNGKKMGLLAGQNENELRWIATRLRQAMNVPARIV